MIKVESKRTIKMSKNNSYSDYCNRPFQVKITLWVLWDKEEQKYISARGFFTKDFSKARFYYSKKEASLDKDYGNKVIKVFAHIIPDK